MSSNGLQFNTSKVLGRLVFVIVFVGMVYAAINIPQQFNTYANSVLVIVTAIYAYLTYELLLSTRQGRSMPYVNVEFILVNKLDDDFLKKNSSFLRPTEKLNKLREDLKRTEYKMNAVFVKVENISETIAVDVNFETNYAKRSLSDETHATTKTISFGELKKGESIVDIVDIFELPSENDYFKIRYCTVEFNDINGRYVKDKPMKNDFSSSAKVTNLLDGIGLAFTLKA